MLVSFMYSKGLFWFRRDLRLSDNAAMHQALLNCKKSAFVFIFDENILSKLIARNDRRITFIWRSLEEIKSKLMAHGTDLLIFYGNPTEIIPALAGEIGAECVFTNRDYEEYALNRDRIVQAKLNEREIKFSTQKDHLIFEANEVKKADGKPYTVFTPYKRTWLTKLAEKREFYLKAYPIEKYLHPDKLIEKGQLENHKSALQRQGFKLVQEYADIKFNEADDLIVTAGEKAANQQFEYFKANYLSDYKNQRDFMSANATSNLSVHLRFGTISIRKCFQEASEVSQGTNNLAEAWLSELIWREFYSMILQTFPIVEKQSFKEEYRNLLWRVDEKLLQAWEEGMTGYPIVDAAMRQLKTTGQMHNRARMITASFLTKDVLIDWRKGEAHFANYLLDFDLASNNGGWQWAASTGTDAVPYFRIFNPSLQSEKFDPKAEYIKKYIPELNDVSANKIHKLDFSVPNYPKPIIRHEEARQAVMELFKKAKAHD